MKDVSKQIRGAHPHTRGRKMTASATAINGDDGFFFWGEFKNCAHRPYVNPLANRAQRKFETAVVVRVFPGARVREGERESQVPLKTGGYQRERELRGIAHCAMWVGGHLKSRVATQLLSRAPKHRARTNTRIAAGTLARGTIRRRVLSYCSSFTWQPIILQFIIHDVLLFLRNI